MNAVLGATILYNPEESVINNILTYINYVGEVVVVDNSDKPNALLTDKLKGLEKVTYISNNGNVGIAKALNVAAEFGKQKNYKWMLTMDQDSLFEKDYFSKFVDDFNKLVADVPNLAILTPYHETQTITHIDTLSKQVYKVKTCMTSGNIVSLDVWEKIGGWAEKLFIDYVDHEYCLRARKNGGEIYETTNAVLKHFLGNSNTFKFLGTRRVTSHHNYLRRYYLTRNRLYFIVHYIFFDPGTCFFEIYALFAETFKMLVEEKNRSKKIQSVMLGVKDFIIGRYGKYPYN
jgi:rhamnosyltransferase